MSGETEKYELSVRWGRKGGGKEEWVRSGVGASQSFQDDPDGVAC